MNLKRYCNEDAFLLRYERRNKDGDPIYAAPEPIKVRVERKNKWQRAKGELVLVDVTIFMATVRIYLGDVVRHVDARGDTTDHEIYAVEDMPNAKGKFLGCEAYPRPPIGFTP